MSRAKYHPSDRPMTEAQRKVWQFFIDFRAERGFPPTYRDVSTAFGVNIGAIYGHVKYLLAKGKLRYLVMDYNRSRALVAVVDTQTCCAVCGRPFENPDLPHPRPNHLKG